MRRVLILEATVESVVVVVVVVVLVVSWKIVVGMVVSL